jgi:lipopolysaccharide transport system ATP-binding protein
MDSIITAENLGKKYILSHQKKEPYTMLRDVVANKMRNFGRKLAKPFSSGTSITDPAHEEFWALKDVSFRAVRGDRIGIIGRNGAGKSTLLKILSRITEPTEGRVRIRGRVASLLEVGTGFHPELTGRENIFLNGAILGMTKAEIKRKFDEIVEFAEVEKFLDTPVKHYSSGMYVRLAFAVAAHLEPEILVVDEVLAVGDAQFQKKCLGKMEDVSAKEGRTVLFVSHNMGAISQLCNRGILLDKGYVLSEGDVRSVIDKYMASAHGQYSGEIIWPDEAMPGDNDLRLKRVSVVQLNETKAYLQDDIGVQIEIALKANKKIDCAVIGLIISDSKGEGVLHTSSDLHNRTYAIKPGSNVFFFSFPPFLLSQGNYSITIGASIPNMHTYFLERDILNFYVETCNPEVNRYPMHSWKGIINPQMGEWDVR